MNNRETKPRRIPQPGTGSPALRGSMPCRSTWLSRTGNARYAREFRAVFGHRMNSYALGLNTWTQTDSHATRLGRKYKKGFGRTRSLFV